MVPILLTCFVVVHDCPGSERLGLPLRVTSRLVRKSCHLLGFCHHILSRCLLASPQGIILNCTCDQGTRTGRLRAHLCVCVCVCTCYGVAAPSACDQGSLTGNLRTEPG